MLWPLGAFPPGTEGPHFADEAARRCSFADDTLLTVSRAPNTTRTVATAAIRLFLLTRTRPRRRGDRSMSGYLPLASGGAVGGRRPGLGHLLGHRTVPERAHSHLW